MQKRGEAGVITENHSSRNLIMISIIIAIIIIAAVLAVILYSYFNKHTLPDNPITPSYSNETVPIDQPGAGSTLKPKTSFCGDGKCNGTENYTNCAKDCKKPGGGGGGGGGGGNPGITTPVCNIGAWADTTEFRCSALGEREMKQTRTICPSGSEEQWINSSCGNGFICSNGNCLELINCTSNENCTYINGTCGIGFCNFSAQRCDVRNNISTQVCRNSNGACDLKETCSGASLDCPPNTFNVSTTSCRTNKSECDAQEFCTGSNETCPSDINKSDETICSLGTCQGGKCTTTCANSCNEEGKTLCSYNIVPGVGAYDIVKTCIRNDYGCLNWETTDHCYTGDCIDGKCMYPNNCTDDPGCNSFFGELSGFFCNESEIYKCTLGNDSCYDKIVKGNCVESQTCFVGYCYSNVKNISSCQVLNESNTLYVLTKGISGSAQKGSSCLYIDNVNVSLDCNSFIVKGNETVDGISLSMNSGKSKIANCNVEESAIGIKFYYSDNNILQKVTSKENNLSGFHLYDSDNNTFYQTESRKNNLDRKYNHQGIRLENSDNNTFESISSYSNYAFGIILIDSESNKLTKVSSSYNLEDGIALVGPKSRYNNFYDLRLEANQQSGIRFDTTSSNNSFLKGLLSRNHADFAGDILDSNFCTNTFDNLSDKDGNIIGFYTSPVEISDMRYSSLVLCKASYSNFTNITVLDQVTIYETNNSYFNELNIDTQERALSIKYSNYNTFKNVFSSAGDSSGVQLYRSKNNFLDNITIMHHEDYGISLDESSNNLLTNIVTNHNWEHDYSYLALNGDGISLIRGSNNNTIINLTSSDNLCKGLEIYNSHGNYIERANITLNGDFYEDCVYKHAVHIYNSENNSMTNSSICYNRKDLNDKYYNFYCEYSYCFKVFEDNACSSSSRNVGTLGGTCAYSCSAAMPSLSPISRLWETIKSLFN